jgi:hypothetical protein
MTPLITFMSKLVAEPETSTWFDIGEMNELVFKLDPDVLVRLPFPEIVIVGTSKHQKFAVLAKETKHTFGDSPTLVVTGFVLTPNFYALPALFVSSEDNHLRLATKDASTGNAVNARLESDNSRLIGVLHVLTERLAKTKTIGYSASIKENYTARRQKAKGKKPSFAWRTVVVEPKPSVEPTGIGSHASPRAHERRGHWRQLKSKRVWVKSCNVGKPSNGVVFHDYKVSDLSESKAP